MKSGIYMIINLINGKYYVGSAIDLGLRWKVHLWYLNANKHKNKHLQNAWNKYGAEAIQFTIVENTVEEKLTEIEQLWISASKCCDREFGYNVRTKAESNFGIKWDDSVKSKMSKALKGKIKSKEWLENIKTGVLKSDKSFKNKRNKEKWPHENGNRCKCIECRRKRYSDHKAYFKAYMHEYHIRNKAKKVHANG